jgi:hypothetical protein
LLKILLIINNINYSGVKIMLKKLKSNISYGIIVVLAATLLTSLAPPHNAYASSHICSADGDFMLYEHSNYSGRQLWLDGTNSLHNLTDFAQWDDEASSYWNNTPCWVAVFEYTNAGGNWFWIQPHSWGSFQNNWWDNRISSVWMCHLDECV